MKNKNTAWFLVRLAIAFAFFYPAVKIHINPDAWLGYFPPFVESLGIPQAIIVSIFTLLHIAVALWILFGKRIFIPSILASIFLLGVIVFNLSQMDILFRDVSLLLVTLALALNDLRETGNA
jgi:hypothetical protein